MMQQAIDIVKGASDVQVIALVKRVHAEVARALTPEALTDGLAEAGPQVQPLASLPPEVRRATLESADAVDASRRLLLALAGDPQTAPLVVEAWDAVRSDDSLFIETVVAVGLLANLTLFLATTEIELTIGGVRIRKGAADATLVRAVVEPLVELVKRIPASP
jgi:hypothetical protein